MFVATVPLCSVRKFSRYAFAVQYHGGNLLGFSYQGRRGENCILYDREGSVQVDLRGVESVEGRIRRALDHLVGSGNYTNIQVSSRTDRGVHAWRNTFQVDIRPRLRKSTDRPPAAWRPKNLVHGINYYLCRLSNRPSNEEADIDGTSGHHQNQPEPTNRAKLQFNHDICILSAALAPAVTIPNKYYDPSLPGDDATNPERLPWDVRFTATRRTYAYQILHSHDICENGESLASDDVLADGWTSCYHSQPFEHDRVWRIHDKDRKRDRRLDIDSMNRAGRHLVGTHDFTSFRGKGCQRSSPVVTLEDVSVGQEEYRGALGGVWRTRSWRTTMGAHPSSLRLVTISVTGKSFLYHQVRNIVACLVDVGKGRLTPTDVLDILNQKDRCRAPGMAPAKGLYLVNVEHGNFRF